MKPRYIRHESASEYFGMGLEPVASVEAHAKATGEAQRARVQKRNHRFGKVVASTAVGVGLLTSPLVQKAIPDGLGDKVTDVARDAYNFLDQGSDQPSPGVEITRGLKQQEADLHAESDIARRHSGVATTSTIDVQGEQERQYRQEFLQAQRASQPQEPPTTIGDSTPPRG